MEYNGQNVIASVIGDSLLRQNTLYLCYVILVFVSANKI